MLDQVWLYIKAKKYQNDDSEYMLLDQLMKLILNKSDILTNSDKWNSKYTYQEHIFTLTSAIKKLKSDDIKLTKVIK